MTTTTVTVEGTLQPDGMTLQLDKKIALETGRVTVTVHRANPASGPTMLEVLDRIDQERKQRGQRMPTEEEMAAEIAQMRGADEEYEARWREIWAQTGTKPERPENS